jgi:hypothetical protein
MEPILTISPMSAGLCRLVISRQMPSLMNFPNYPNSFDGLRHRVAREREVEFDCESMSNA